MAKNKDFIAHFTVLNGRIKWKNTEYIRVNLAKYEGKSGYLIIKEKFNKRSNDQNSLYWSWLGVMSESIGHSEEELHVVLRGLYAPRKEIKVGGKSYMIPMSTTEFTVGQFVEYLLRIEAQAAELGIILPSPEEYKALLDSAQLINE